MATYRFPINGLRHHDFKECLDELYELGPGKRMSISVEHDNPGEDDAVIVYWGKRHVGYVRSGRDRECAYSLITGSGRGSMLGRIVDIDREKRYLWMEVYSEQTVTLECSERPNMLQGLAFDGEMLPVDEEEVRLHTMLCNLEMVVECREPWDEDTEEWLCYVQENLWRDISCETSEQVRRILDCLTSGGADMEEYAQAANRLQYAIDYMGSPEVRRLQAQQILDKSRSKAMDLLLLRYAERAKDVIDRLPRELVTLFMEDGEVFMGRLWYLHIPYKQVQAIKTLLAMMIRLKDNAGEAVSTSIPEQWIINWAKRKENADKADFARELISTFEMERRSPELCQELDSMDAACRPKPTIGEYVAAKHVETEIQTIEAGGQGVIKNYK